MKPLLRLLLVGSSVVSTLVAGEPLAFKGDALGGSLWEFYQKYRRPVKGSIAPHLVPDPDGACIVTARKSFPFEQKSEETIAGVSVELPIAYIFYARHEADWRKATTPDLEWKMAIKSHSESLIAAARRSERPKSFAPPSLREWNFDEQQAADRLKLGSIEIYFPTSKFGDVLAGLSERYGTQRSELVVQMQNGFGATFPSRIIEWRISETQTIELRERVARKDLAVARYIDSSIVDDSVRSTKKAREAAKDL